MLSLSSPSFVCAANRHCVIVFCQSHLLEVVPSLCSMAEIMRIFGQLEKEKQGEKAGESEVEGERNRKEKDRGKESKTERTVE